MKRIITAVVFTTLWCVFSGAFGAATTQPAPKPACALDVTPIDASYCRCEQGADETKKTCHGGGTKVFNYACNGGTCPADENCVRIKTAVRKTISATPVCIRVGAPADPTCAVKADCTINSWNETKADIADCGCKPCKKP